MYGTSSSIIHGSLKDGGVNMAKRACLDNEMCFGISVSANSGEVTSFAFPFYMKLGSEIYLHQKETQLGIFIYSKSYKNINSL